MFYALFLLLNLSPVFAEESFCSSTHVYENGFTTKRCTFGDAQANISDIRKMSTEASKPEEFLSLVKATALKRMQSLSETIKSPLPGDVSLSLKTKNSLNRFWSALSTARIEFAITERAEDMHPHVVTKETLTPNEATAVSQFLLNEYSAPDWNDVKKKFLNKDYRTESSIFNARYMPLAQNAKLEAEQSVHRMAKAEQEKIVANQPLLHYIHTPDPTKADVEAARQQYAKDLDSAISKMKSLDPVSNEAKPLVLFKPAVDDVLRAHPEYCEALSTLLNEVQSAQKNRSADSMGVSVSAGLTCGIAGVLSEEVLLLPCIFAAAGSETAVTLDSANLAMKESDVLYSGYLGRQTDLKARDARRAEAGGHLIQAGVITAGAGITAAQTSGLVAKVVDESNALSMLKSTSEVHEFQVTIENVTANKIDLDWFVLSKTSSAHIVRRHSFDRELQKQYEEILQTAKENPDLARKMFKNNSRLQTVTAENKLGTSVVEDTNLISKMIESAAKSGKLKKLEPGEDGFVKVRTKGSVPVKTIDENGKVKIENRTAIGEVVVCGRPKCNYENGYSVRKGEIVTAYIQCGPGARWIPQRRVIEKIIAIRRAADRAAALDAISDEISQVRECD